MRFERYGHLFNHTTKCVAQTAGPIFAALEPDCRTIVVNAAHRFIAAETKTPKLFTE